IDRLSGDPYLADDLAQEAFVRLYRRGELPESPRAWLATVALNLLRNERSRVGRRRRLLAATERSEADPAPSPPLVLEAAETRDRVRLALDGLPDRERAMLLLRAEGYGYREIGEALGIAETSVGTLLARAKRAFVVRYGEASHAS